MPPLFSRLYLHEDFAPLPLLRAVNSLSLPRSDTVLRIGGLHATFDGPDLTPSIDWTDSWMTSTAAVEDSFRTEFLRVLDYVRPLAVRVRVAARDTAGSPDAAVTFDSPPIPTAGVRTSGGHRLRRALADAVRASGRKPSPFGSEVIDLEHWSATVDTLFAELPPVSDEVVAVAYDFLPVVAEWLRADAVAAGRSRHLIRADLGLPADLDAYRQAAALLPTAVGNTLERLAESLTEDGDRLARLRKATRAVVALQDEFPRGSGRVRVGVVFAEHSNGPGYVVPAVGLRVPPPPGGYPLMLADGTLARLPRPPWTMGSSSAPGVPEPEPKKKRRTWRRRHA